MRYRTLRISSSLILDVLRQNNFVPAYWVTQGLPADAKIVNAKIVNAKMFDAHLDVIEVVVESAEFPVVDGPRWPVIEITFALAEDRK